MDEETEPYRPRTPPYHHQLEALRRMEGRRAFALFHEMGTGKTKTLIDDIGRLHLAGEVSRVLITAGKGSYRVWSRELLTHMSDQVEWVEHIWDGSTGSRSRHSWQALMHDYRPERVLHVLIVNVEALGSSSRARQHVEAFCCHGPLMVVVDESTLIKSRDAVRTKFLTRVGGQASYRRIATGSPVTRDPLDLWSQFEFLGPGLLGQRSYWGFVGRYAIVQEMQLGGRRVRKPVAFQRLPELESLVAAHSHRVLKEECLDLPEKIYQEREVEWDPRQREIYDEMRRHSIAELDDETEVTATTAMVRVMRMHQILCGHLRDDATGEVREVPTRRIDSLLELLEEAADQQTIVWCAYRADVMSVARRLREVYGHDSVVEYWGDTSPEDRETAISRLQSGDARFFVATAATGGYGITLTAASLVVYYSNTYDLERRIQSEDRAHRIGQRRSVTYVDLIVPGTVDERIVDALRRKIDVASTVMGDGYREWLR